MTTSTAAAVTPAIVCPARDQFKTPAPRGDLAGWSVVIWPQAFSPPPGAGHTLSVMPAVFRNGLPESRPYRYRAGASRERVAELERLRVLLDRQAGYGEEDGAREVPEEAEEAVPDPAARCRACRFLVTSAGHRVCCG